MDDFSALVERLDRVVDALERLAPTPIAQQNLDIANAFLWDAEHNHLQPVTKINRVDLSLRPSPRHPDR